MPASFIFTFQPEYEKNQHPKALFKTQLDVLLASGGRVLWTTLEDHFNRKQSGPLSAGVFLLMPEICKASEQN